MRIPTVALFVLALGALAAPAQDPAPKPAAKPKAAAPPGTPEGFRELQTGDAAPEFSLKGIDDKMHTLAEYKSDVLMIFFTSNHCPVCHAAEPRLIQLVKDLKGKSFEVVAINPNNPEGLRVDELGYSKYNDSFDEMKLYAKEMGFTFPYLYDGDTQAVAKSYGCLATPHVFIFDKERKLRYQGWLDDSRFIDAASVKKPDARNAVVALLEGKAVPVEKTHPFGCSTKWMTKNTSVQQDDKKWASAPVNVEAINAAGIEALMKNPTNKYRLINVWSTTCVPCVAEFPGLIHISRRMGLRKFELITISADDPKDTDKVKAFLDKQRAALPSGLEKSLKDEGRKTNNYVYSDASVGDLMKAVDPKWQGAIPHTVLVEPGGKVLFSHTGAIAQAELQEKILEHMTGVYQPGKD